MDGSTDPNSIFLFAPCPRSFGRQCYFSNAGLSRLEAELCKIAREISKASDFVLKFDVDEFMVAHKGDPKCRHAATDDDKNIQEGSTVDRSLSPYAVPSVMHNLRRIATGERLKVGNRILPSVYQMKRRTMLAPFRWGNLTGSMYPKRSRILAVW